MKKIISLIFITFILTSCAIDTLEDKRDVNVYNKSDKTVYCIVSSTDIFKKSYLTYNEPIMDRFYKILPDSVKSVYDKPSNWKRYIKQCQGGRMRFFVISKDSVDKYGWSKIFSQNIYTKVYKLNFEDLNKIKWTIRYDDK